MWLNVLPNWKSLQWDLTYHWAATISLLQKLFSTSKWQRILQKSLLITCPTVNSLFSLQPKSNFYSDVHTSFCWHAFPIPNWLGLANPGGLFVRVWVCASVYPVRCERKSGNSSLLLKESWKRDSLPFPLDIIMPAWQKALELWKSSYCREER